MNFLHAAVLSAIVIEYVSASADVKAQFRTAVDGNDVAKAAKVCKENKSLCSEEIDYVIERKPSEFVVGFIKAAGVVNRFTLASIYKKTSATKRASGFIEKVLDEIEFTDRDLAEVASQYEQVCVPQQFIELVSRIQNGEIQAYAVRVGISDLFPGHIDCIDPLLGALEDSTSLSKGVKDTTIQAIFNRAAYSRNSALVRRFCHHPAVTHEVYAEGIISSWTIYETENTVFPILLEEAERGDLEAVKR